MKKFLWMTAAMATSFFASMAVQADDWYDNISFNGKFRYRYEFIDDETNTDEVEHRNRIQLKLGMKAKIHDDLTFDLRLSTGGSPTSRNQTLTGSYSPKDLFVDKANVVWKPTFSNSLEGLSIVLGKYEDPFWTAGKSDLVFDGDLTPEGGYAKYVHSWESFKLSSVLSGTWLNEDKSAADSGMLGLQVVGGMTFLDKKLGVDLGVSYFNYGNVAGFATNFAAAAKAEQDYDLINIGLNVSYAFEFAPVSLFGDYVVNTGDETSEDTGFLIGFKIGAIKEAHDWQFSYDFRELEAQAAPSNFTDGDSSGGKTDITGHRIGFNYAIYKPWTIGTTIYVGEKGTKNGTDYTKVHLNLVYSF